MENKRRSDRPKNDPLQMSHTDPTQELRDAPEPSADPPAVHRSLIRNGRVAVKKSFLEKGSGRNA